MVVIMSNNFLKGTWWRWLHCTSHRENIIVTVIGNVHSRLSQLGKGEGICQTGSKKLGIPPTTSVWFLPSVLWIAILVEYRSLCVGQNTNIEWHQWDVGDMLEESSKSAKHLGQNILPCVLFSYEYCASFTLRSSKVHKNVKMKKLFLFEFLA